MNKFDKWLENNKWVLMPFLYVLICVYTYYSTTVTIEGITLPQHESGLYGLVGLHVMGFVAMVFAYLLHWIVELISRIFK